MAKAKITMLLDLIEKMFGGKLGKLQKRCEKFEGKAFFNEKWKTNNIYNHNNQISIYLFCCFFVVSIVTILKKLGKIKLRAFNPRPRLL